MWYAVTAATDNSAVTLVTSERAVVDSIPAATFQDLRLHLLFIILKMHISCIPSAQCEEVTEEARTGRMRNVHLII